MHEESPILYSSLKPAISGYMLRAKQINQEKLARPDNPDSTFLHFLTVIAKLCL